MTTTELLHPDPRGLIQCTPLLARQRGVAGGKQQVADDATESLVDDPPMSGAYALKKSLVRLRQVAPRKIHDLGCARSQKSGSLIGPVSRELTCPPAPARRPTGVRCRRRGCLTVGLLFAKARSSSAVEGVTPRALDGLVDQLARQRPRFRGSAARAPSWSCHREVMVRPGRRESPSAAPRSTAAGRTGAPKHNEPLPGRAPPTCWKSKPKPPVCDQGVLRRHHFPATTSRVGVVARDLTDPQRQLATRVEGLGATSAPVVRCADGRVRRFRCRASWCDWRFPTRRGRERAQRSGWGRFAVSGNHGSWHTVERCWQIGSVGRVGDRRRSYSAGKNGVVVRGV